MCGGRQIKGEKRSKGSQRRRGTGTAAMAKSESSSVSLSLRSSQWSTVVRPPVLARSALGRASASGRPGRAASDNATRNTYYTGTILFPESIPELSRDVQFRKAEVPVGDFPLCKVACSFSSLPFPMNDVVVSVAMMFLCSFVRSLGARRDRREREED